MVGNIARRDLLRGHLTTRTEPIRPPGAIVERDFLSLCVPCDDCATACSHGLVEPDNTGRPVMNFQSAQCVFCGDCTSACSSGALNEQRARPWNVVAKISPNCLSLNGVSCRICADHCDEQAISFKLMTRGRSQPVLSNNHCTGCGACLNRCPNKSIDMTSLGAPKQGANQ